MQAEDLKEWLQEALRDKNPVRRQWRLLVSIIQRMFKYGVVPEEVAGVTMVFLKNGGGGIGI